MKGTPHLQTVVLMSIIQAAQHAMFIKKDGRRRLFILDEAWEYIRPDNASGSSNHSNQFFSPLSLRPLGADSGKRTVPVFVLLNPLKITSPHRLVAH
nr:hypothetical protein [Escherichia coli]